MRYILVPVLIAAGTAFLIASRAERTSFDAPLISKRGRIVIGLFLVMAGLFLVGTLLLWP